MSQPLLNDYKDYVSTCSHMLNTQANDDCLHHQNFILLKARYWHAYCTLLSKKNGMAKSIDINMLYDIEQINKVLFSTIDQKGLCDPNWLEFEAKIVFSILYLSYFFKMSVPQGIWQKMHQIDHAAAQLKGLTIQAKKVLADIQTYYKQALILAMFTPYQLEEHEFLFIFHNLAQFTKLISIDDSSHCCDNSVSFNAAIDWPFFRYDDSVKQNPGQKNYHIDLTRLKDFLNSRFRLSRNWLVFRWRAYQHKVDIQMISDVLQRATSTFIRVSARTTVQRPCKVATSLQHSWGFASSMEHTPFYELSEVTPIHAQTVNMSETGLCIEIVNPTMVFKPREIIYLSVEPHDEYYLGLIKWVTLSKDNKMAVGIEKLSINPLPCLFVKQKYHLQTDQIGFLCYNYKSYESGIYLIVSKANANPSSHITLWTSTDMASKHDFKRGAHFEDYNNYSIWKLNLLSN